MSSYMVAIQVVGAVSYNPIIPDDDNIIASEGKFTLLAQSPSVILFDPVIRSGIVRFEVNNERDLHGVGIADESVHFTKDEAPWIHHIGDEIDGNKNFVKDGTITLELNMDSSPRTLTFFNQGKEQKNYVRGLPSAVRLWAYFLAVGAIFEVTQFERLDSPTAKHGPKSVGWRWGEQWDDPDF